MPDKAPSDEAVRAALEGFYGPGSSRFFEGMTKTQAQMSDALEAALPHLLEDLVPCSAAEKAVEKVLEQRDEAEAALLEARQTLVAIERHQYFIDKRLPVEVKSLVRGGREPLQRMARAAFGSPEEADRG